jgi:hypothetical protein
MKHDVWDDLTHRSNSPSPPPRQQPEEVNFIPTNPIEDALKVSYKQSVLKPTPTSLTPPPLTLSPSASSAIYSSASHLQKNSLKKKHISPSSPSPPPPSVPPLYQHGNKLQIKPRESQPQSQPQPQPPRYQQSPHGILQPSQILKTSLSDQLQTMKRLIDEEQTTRPPLDSSAADLSPSVDNSQYLDEYFGEQEEEGDLTADTELENDHEAEGEEESVYQSDDEADALRSLPTTGPFLNTELSQDLETEYEENDDLALPTVPLTKVKGRSSNASTKMSHLYSEGIPLGSKQSQTLSRKVRSQSPNESGAQTKKVSDESETILVSQQKRVTPEKPPAAGNAKDKEQKLQSGRVAMDLPPPPPPPQPRALLHSPQPPPASTIEFDSDLLIDRNEVSRQRREGGAGSIRFSPDSNRRWCIDHVDSQDRGRFLWGGLEREMESNSRHRGEEDEA